MTSRTRSAWPWVLALVASVVAGVVALTAWTGVCIDVAVDSPALSTCTVAPALGWSGAIAFAAICGVVAVWAVVRIVRR